MPFDQIDLFYFDDNFRQIALWVFSLEGGNPLFHVTEIKIEMDLYFYGQKASKGPI